MDQESIRIRRKKLIIAIICLVIVVLAILGLSFGKYVIDENRGEAYYEPALFNTVLLGQLVKSDIDNLQSMTNETYTVVEDGTTYSQIVSGKKLTTSIDLSEEVEFGGIKEDGSLSAEAKISPGENGTDGAVYFTVTNGTQVVDESVAVDSTKTEADDDTTTGVTRIANVAQSDIRYTIHIITTNNLPLEYSLVDLDTETEYELTDTLDTGSSNTNGNYNVSCDYIVKNTDASSKVFVNGTRLLKCNSDGSITVHRYKIVVNWPSEGSRKIGNEEIANNDMVYMKELENIEVLLEVESYVNHVAQNTDVGEQYAKGILVLNSTPSTKSDYNLTSITQDTSAGKTVTKYSAIANYANKVVRYDNFSSISADDLLHKTNSILSNGYKYDFCVCNGDSISAVWQTDDADTDVFEDSVSGTSSIREANGHADKDGHYVYSGTYTSGSYTVAMAVPTSANGFSDYDRSETSTEADDDRYEYYIIYNGTVYTGVYEDGYTVTTDVYEQSEATLTSDPEFSYNTSQIYKVMKFYDLNDEAKPLLKLDMNGAAFDSKDLTLYMGKKTAYESSKDEFRLYMISIAQ